MSGESEVPVIVSVSTYDGVQENNAINVYAQPVSNNQVSSDYDYPTAVGYASPPVSAHQAPTSVRAHAIPQTYGYGGSFTTTTTTPPLRVGNTDHLQVQPSAFHVDERMLRVTTVARSVKCLAVIDLCLLLLLSIFQFGWVFLLWGPVCGYFGTNRFKVRLLYVYVFYWGIRSLVDAVIAVVFGYWWFIISLLVDLYILRYIWQFCVMLKGVPSASLYFLQHAADVNQTPQAHPATSRSQI